MADEGFYESVTSGDLRKGLEALRDYLAKELDGDADSKSVAAIAKQLADVMQRLDGMPGEEKSTTDDLAERRAKRRAQVSKRAGRSVERGPGGG